MVVYATTSNLYAGVARHESTNPFVGFQFETESTTSVATTTLSHAPGRASVVQHFPGRGTKSYAIRPTDTAFYKAPPELRDLLSDFTSGRNWAELVCLYDVRYKCGNA